MERVALSPREFAELFGKEQTWGYRQIYSGKVTTITEYGRILIPASEVERILGEAAKFNGLKRKAAERPTKERGTKLEAWRRFIANGRKPETSSSADGDGKPRRPLSGPKGQKATSAFERLAKRQKGR